MKYEVLLLYYASCVRNGKKTADDLCGEEKFNQCRCVKSDSSLAWFHQIVPNNDVGGCPPHQPKRKSCQLLTRISK